MLLWLFLAVSLPGLLGFWAFLENSDVEQYVAMVSGTPVPAPFCYRPTVPWLASMLPWLSPISALRCVSALSTLGTVLVLDRLLMALRTGARERMVGALLFLVSFPTTAYGASAYIDASVLFVLTAGTWALLSEAWISFALILGLGALVSEKVCLLLVLGAVLFRWRVLPFVGLLVAVELAIRTGTSASGSFVWWPTLLAMEGNLTSGRWVRVALSLGLPFVLVIWALRRFGWRLMVRDESDRILLVGLFSVLFLILYATLSFRVDGHFAWHTTCFTIPLAMRWSFPKGASKS